MAIIVSAISKIQSTPAHSRKRRAKKKRINRKIAAALTFSAPSHLVSSALLPHRLFRRPNMNSVFSSRAHTLLSAILVLAR